jgi:hypothetical protein
VLVLPSEDDEFVPPHVDKAQLLARWRRLAPAGIVSPLSGLVPDATHVLLRPEGQAWVADRVLGFLRGIK